MQDMSFDYTNYRGEPSRRTVTVISHRYGASQWHPEPQWLMMALDHDKGEPREFAVKDMVNIETHMFPVMRRDGSKFQSPLRDLIRRIDIVAQNHMSYSQACGPLGNLRDHLSAMAFCEEVNRDDHRRLQGNSRSVRPDIAAHPRPEATVATAAEA